MNKIEQCAEDIKRGHREAHNTHCSLCDEMVDKAFEKHFPPVESFTLATILQQGHSQLSVWAGPLNVKDDFRACPDCCCVACNLNRKLNEALEIIKGSRNNICIHHNDDERSLVRYTPCIVCLAKELNEALSKLAMAEDAAAKVDLARQTAGGMEMEIQELREKLAEVNNLIESHKLDLEAQKNSYERKLAGAAKELKEASDLYEANHD